MNEYSPAKTGEYPRIVPNFQNCARCEKGLKDNKDNSLHLGRNYARIFVRGHYLFRETDNVRGQISEHIFARNGDYCLYILAPNGSYLRVCPREDQADVTHAISPISLKLSQMIKVIWPQRYLPTTFTNNCRHLAREYARIFVRGHYLFREANSFPRAKLEENCELRGTDNVQGQISEHIFAPNGDFCLYYPSNLFRNVRNFQNWGIFSDIPQF